MIVLLWQVLPLSADTGTSRKNNNLWEMAGELQQENKGKILPERLWDSSPVAAWVEGCRGARGKPSAVRKAKVASYSILSVWSLMMHF